MVGKENQIGSAQPNLVIASKAWQSAGEASHFRRITAQRCSEIRFFDYRFQHGMNIHLGRIVNTYAAVHASQRWPGGV